MAISVNWFLTAYPLGMFEGRRAGTEAQRTCTAGLPTLADQPGRSWLVHWPYRR